MKRPWKYCLVGLLGSGIAGTVPYSAIAFGPNISGPEIVESEIVESGTIEPETIEQASELEQNAERGAMERGRQAYGAGQFAIAIQSWQLAAEEAQQQGDTLTQAIAQSHLSSAYQVLNQWDNAQKSIDTSVALLEKYPQDTHQAIDPRLQAQVINTQASLAYHLGQAEAAMALWEQAEDFYRQAKDDSGILGSQINQAQALQSLGFYRRSRQQLETIAEQLSTLPDSELKVNGLRTLGTALQVLGDLPGSRAALFESANIAIAINATNELSATYLSLGRTASDWGDDVAVLDLLNRAKQSAMNPTDTLQADLSRLRFYTERTNSAAESAEMARTATAIAEQLKHLPPSRLMVYGTVNLSASLAKAQALKQSSSEQSPLEQLPLEQSPLEQSVPITEINQLLAKAVTSAQALHDPQAEAYALNQWGSLYIQTEQWSEALKLTEKSLEIARTIHADDIASQSAWQLGRILKQQSRTAEAVEAYSEAVDSLKSLRSDLVAIDPDIQFSFRENVEPIYREMVSLLLTGNSPDQQSLAKAREVIEALQLAELDNFFQEACIDVTTQQIDQVDGHATVIYPIILPDKLAVIASSAGQPLAYYTTAVSAQTVETTLRELLSSIHPASDNQQRLALSQQVYDWLIRPAEASHLTSNTQTLVFVLDGLLRNVPMAALHDGDQYLIEKYAVALSPGLQLMSAQSLEHINSDAVVGGISEARNGLSALPAVKEEILDIAQRVSAQTLINEEFTSERLASEVENSSASIVHLATHGQFSSRLEDTFLSTWEGQLSVQELSEILRTRGRSSAIELLVLSACDTASGDDRAVLGLAGLAIKSGARSTVATLWPVKDQAAAKLMSALYENIDKASMTKAEALRQAQLSLLQDPSYSDPFFWSAYTLVGNWR
jgi:CHAT domain-containing protein